MKKQIRNLVYICLAGVTLVLIPLFLSKSEPINLDMPVVDIPKMLQQREEEEKEAKIAAERAAEQEAVRRAFQCTTDDDCIIVSRDPCGCLIGPQGVIAVNVESSLVFVPKDKPMRPCPNTAPSTEAQCSATAKAVCWKDKCTIVY